MHKWCKRLDTFGLQFLISTIIHICTAHYTVTRHQIDRCRVKLTKCRIKNLVFIFQFSIFVWATIKWKRNVPSSCDRQLSNKMEMKFSSEILEFPVVIICDLYENESFSQPSRIPCTYPTLNYLLLLRQLADWTIAWMGGQVFLIKWPVSKNVHDWLYTQVTKRFIICWRDGRSTVHFSGLFFFPQLGGLVIAE